MSDIRIGIVTGTVGKFITIKDNRLEYSVACNTWNHVKEEETTMWIPCKQWGKTQEHIEKLAGMITQGTSITVNGQINIWKDKEDKPRFELNVKEFKIGKYGQPKENTNQDAPAYGNPPNGGNNYSKNVERPVVDTEKDGMPW